MLFESAFPGTGHAVTVAYIGFDTGNAIAVGTCDRDLYAGFPQMVPYTETPQKIEFKRLS